MKKKGRWVALGLAAALIAGWLWWSRPMTLGQMFPALQGAAVTSMSGTFRIPGGAYHADDAQTGNSTSALAEEVQAAVGPLLDALFSRSLLGTIQERYTGGSRSAPITGADTDFSMYVSFFFDGEEVTFLQLDFFYGELTFTLVQPGGRETTYRCSSKGHEALMTNLLAYLQENLK